MQTLSTPSSWRRWLVAALVLALVLLGLVSGLRLFGLSAAAAATRALAIARGPWALPAVVGAFAVLAFLGAPQFALIAAAVAVFGPWLGGIYSWIGTMVSALAGFWIGRAAWAPAARLEEGERAGRLIALIGRHGFAASFLIRQIPAAPFVIVNMAAGAAPMRLWAFSAGTALGIIPKIALTAAAGRLARAALAGNAIVPGILFGGAIIVWLAAAAWARVWLRRREGSSSNKAGANAG
ncbi:MAG TPA: VTT domain-containing protein [Caulobacteraceae bacterium]|nr:VTT domain-containing protein [Caulobacteraceae bacterium]